MIRFLPHYEYTLDLEYEEIRTILGERFGRNVSDIILEMLKEIEEAKLDDQFRRISQRRQIIREWQERTIARAKHEQGRKRLHDI